MATGLRKTGFLLVCTVAMTAMHSMGCATIAQDTHAGAKQALDRSPDVVPAFALCSVNFMETSGTGMTPGKLDTVRPPGRVAGLADCTVASRNVSACDRRHSSRWMLFRHRQ